VQTAPRDVATAQIRDAPPPLRSSLLSKPERPGNRRARLTSAARHLRPEGIQASDHTSGSDLLGPSFTNLVGLERHPGHRPARHSGPLASLGVPAPLATDLEARSRKATNSARGPSPHSAICNGKRLARPKGSSGTREAWDLSQSRHCLSIFTEARS
jgi:hypothetical protein